MPNTASPQIPARPSRAKRARLTALTLVAIGLAALLAWTTVLKDDVMLATVTGMSGEIAFTPTLKGKPVDDASPSDRTPESTTTTDAPTGSDDISGGGSDTDAGDSDPGTSPGPGTAETPPPADSSVSIDGFHFTSGDNLAPGDRQTGEITLRNTGAEPIRVRMDVTGSDPYDCFTFAATPKMLDPTGAWVPVADARLRGTPAVGGSAPIGIWNAGREYRLHVELEMNRACTVGSGLSSNGSAALADRHPDHASARLQFRFVAEGFSL